MEHPMAIFRSTRPVLQGLQDESAIIEPFGKVLSTSCPIPSPERHLQS